MRKRQYLLAPLLCLAALFSGCGGGATSTKGGNSGGGSGNLDASSDAVDFGKVKVGASKTKQLVLQNTSTTDAITVSNLNATGTGFDVTSAPAVPFLVDAGKSVTVGLTFTPKTKGAADGSLTVSSDAVEPVEVTMSGSGVMEGQLSVTPASLNFGDVNVGDSKALSGSLAATDANVTVSFADWNGPGYTVSGITFPLSLTAGKSASFTVTFTPEDSGKLTGQVTFESNASNSPSLQSFKGNGMQLSQHNVALAWDASTSDVAGYNVYRGTKSGGPYLKLNASLQTDTAYNDSDVESGATYYYVATAVDSHSAESGYSNERQAVIPSP